MHMTCIDIVCVQSQYVIKLYHGTFTIFNGYNTLHLLIATIKELHDQRSKTLNPALVEDNFECQPIFFSLNQKLDILFAFHSDFDQISLDQ